MSGHACSASSSCNTFWQGCGLLEGWIDADEANEVSGKYTLQLQNESQLQDNLPSPNVPTMQVIHSELQAQPSHSEGIPWSHFQIISQNWVGGNPAWECDG